MPPEALASSNPGAFLVLALALPVAGILLVFLAAAATRAPLRLRCLRPGSVSRRSSPAKSGGQATRSYISPVDGLHPLGSSSAPTGSPRR